MASVVVEIIASIAEAGAVAGEVAAEAATAAEAVEVGTEIGEAAAVISEEVEAVAGTEIEAVAAEVETAEVSEVVTTEVEEITESEVAAEVDAEVEETVDETAEEEAAGGEEGSTTGSSKVTLKTIAKWANRLLLAYTIVDMVGKYINNLLNPPTPPKTPPTQEQKDLLTKLMDAATRLKDIYHSWQEAIKPLKMVDLGKLSTKDKDGKQHDVLVTDVVDSLLTRSGKSLDQLKPLVKSTSNEINDDTLKKLSTGIYKALLPLDTICYLKSSGKANALKMFKFPSDEDCKEVANILDKDFDMDAKKKAMEKVQSILTQAVKDQAIAAGKAAATQLLKPDVEARVKSKVNDTYVATAKQRATDAAKKAAKDKANSYKGEMIGYALIPIYGMIKVNQLKKEVKRKAEDAAKQAASNTVKAYMSSAEVKSGIQKITREETQSVYQEKKAQVTQAVKQATSAVFKKALGGQTSMSFLATPLKGLVQKAM